MALDARRGSFAYDFHFAVLVHPKLTDDYVVDGRRHLPPLVFISGIIKYYRGCTQRYNLVKTIRVKIVATMQIATVFT